MKIEVYNTPNHGKHIQVPHSGSKKEKWIFAHCVGNTFATLSNMERVEDMLFLHGVNVIEVIDKTTKG